MANITGPFDQIKFLGATVRDIQSSAGAQELTSQLIVTLVEDPKAKDRFIIPETGTPLSFSFQGFHFHGVCQKWGKSRSTSGDPTYSVTLFSPSDILENVKLILNSFRGANIVMPNLFNIFGFLEGPAGFGGSKVNESGIPWHKVVDAIKAIQTGTTHFGTGIEFKGHKYEVDTGTLPQNIPDFYRLGGGVAISLNQAIRTVFEDAAYDYISCLEIKDGVGPHRIYFKTRSRLTQEPLGQVAAFVEGKKAEGVDIISFEEGAELRNDITGGVILGGDVEEIIPRYETGGGNTIYPFWGFEQSNFLIPFGLEGNQPLVSSSGVNNNHIAILNAAPVADIIGTFYYDCSVFEMRCALVDIDSWSCFVIKKRPEIARLLGLSVIPGIFTKDAFHENPQSMYANNAIQLSFITDFEDQPGMRALERLYDFVRSQAETYFGKQFLVRVPFLIKSYFEDETNKLFLNYSVNSDGYWADYIGGNSGPLGLNYENFNHFMTDSGKFIPFIKFGGPEIFKANLGGRSQDDIFIQDNEIFVRCNVDSRILFAPAPAVLITLDEPIWSVPPDPVGGIEDVAWLMEIEPAQLVRIIEVNGGEFPVKLHPWPFTPIGAAICLKSNEYTYGPWVKNGVPGNVRIEQDPGLVPWNYGGFDTMKTAAEAQLADLGSFSQREESGTVSFPGAPDISLGDKLNDIGPVVTSIDVSISPESGITTTYRMRSQTPVYGTFSKQNADRLRRLGTASQDARRTIRALFDRIRSNDRLISSANWQFLQNQSRGIKKIGGNNVLQAFMTEDSVTGAILPQISSQPFAGGVGSSNAHDSEKYKMTASMGWEGLIRPFSTFVRELFRDVPGGTDDRLPHFELPHEDAIITNTDLNPFTNDADILWTAAGNEFNGFYTGRGDLDTTNVRPFALRGPMVLSGWGFDIFGNPIPNEDEDDPTVNFLENYRQRSNKWKVGAIDFSI
jgi:hypothetical protein